MICAIYFIITRVLLPVKSGTDLIETMIIFEGGLNSDGCVTSTLCRAMRMFHQ